MEIINIEKLKKKGYQTLESYKNLRTNVMLSGKENRVIMVTSCTPNEGKSTVSFNLAISMAEAGKKVLFLDLDLRKSVLVGRFKIRKAIRGVTHYLAGQNELEEVIYGTNNKNLDMILSGPVPPNPAELLDSAYFRDMMARLKSNYEYIIVDTPPLGSVIDAAIVAQSCDAAVLVVSAKNVSYKFAQNVLDQLKKTDIRIIGTVLNKVDLSDNRYYGRYYGKYYGRYYGRYGHESSESGQTKSAESQRRAVSRQSELQGDMPQKTVRKSVE